jgi:hypothetical protein
MGIVRGVKPVGSVVAAVVGLLLWAAGAVSEAQAVCGARGRGGAREHGRDVIARGREAAGGGDGR